MVLTELAFQSYACLWDHLVLVARWGAEPETDSLVTVVTYCSIPWRVIMVMIEGHCKIRWTQTWAKSSVLCSKMETSMGLK